MSIVALSPGVAPAITCPSWCVVPMADHVADLPNMDGMVIHWSASVGEIRHSAAAYPDGTLDESDPPLVFVDADTGTGVPLDEAEAIAHAILAAVQEARS